MDFKAHFLRREVGFFIEKCLQLHYNRGSISDFLHKGDDSMSEKPMKMLTFSYDDGVTQDQRLVDLFNKYDLKCTFNLNSDLGGQCALWNRDGISYTHARFQKNEFPRVYAGHEVAVHTLTHPHLNQLSDEAIVREVEQDRLQLSDIMGCEVVGMAYPYGDGSVDSRVAELVRRHTGVKYARLTSCVPSFDPQTDLINFHPNAYHCHWDEMLALGQKFIELETDTPKLFYIWGHAYEFDMDNSWSRFEAFLKLIAHRDDIRYVTNAEALL